MRTRQRGRLMTPFRIVMVTGLGILAMVAWKYQWMPLHVGTAQTGALMNSASEDLSTTTQNQGVTEQREPVLEQETLSAQSEPPAEVLEAGSDNQRSYQSEDVDIPRVFKRTTSGEIVETSPTIDSLQHAAKEPEPFKESAKPLTRQNPVPRQLASRDGNSPKKFNPPEGMKRAASPVIKTAKQASFKEETGGAQAEDSIPDLIAIDELIQKGKIIDAHQRLSKIYWKQPQYYPVLKSRIEETARMIYFSSQPHFMTPYEIEPGDQLRKVSQQYKITWEYLAKLNQIDPRKIRPGQKLKVIKGPFSVFVDLSEFTLTVHSHGYFVKRYRIGTGKDHSTPTGKFQVKEKLVDPTYYGPDGVIANDDPENPLGERWIDIGDSYGIHGTINPDSIGKAESKGCIRMQNKDVAEVYDLLGVGSEVVIRP